jgi:hypothetical protein
MSLETGRKLVTMGRIPWQKLVISKSQGRQIISIIRSETHVLDLSVMLTLAFFSEKVGRYLYRSIYQRLRENVSYDESITKQVEVNLGQAAKLGLVCYTFDAFEIVLEVTGIKGKQTDISTIAAKLIYATWIALRARVYKRQFFEAAFEYANKLSPQRKKKGVGKVEIVDKVSMIRFMHVQLFYLHSSAAFLDHMFNQDHGFFLIWSTLVYLDRYPTNQNGPRLVVNICTGRGRYTCSYVGTAGLSEAGDKWIGHFNFGSVYCRRHYSVGRR